ncbi:hypothetical protein HC762_00570, partial [bacterium]|nr:hypothetical protein [bacterium]
MFNYTATQADVDRGTIVNAASAAAPGAPTATDTVMVRAVPRNASYTFTKTADGPFAAAGDVVNRSGLANSIVNRAISRSRACICLGKLLERVFLLERQFFQRDSGRSDGRPALATAFDRVLRDP